MSMTRRMFVIALLVAVFASPILLAQQSSKPAVYVVGHVRSPGKYPLSDDITVMQAIAIAGGPTERGSLRNITIRRIVDGQRTDIAAQLDHPVVAADLVMVRAIE